MTREWLVRTRVASFNAAEVHRVVYVSIPGIRDGWVSDNLLVPLGERVSINGFRQVKNYGHRVDKCEVESMHEAGILFDGKPRDETVAWW